MGKTRLKADFTPEFYSGENLLINGCMSENQRNQSGELATTGYTLDRWVVRGSNQVGGTVNVEQIEDSNLGFAIQIQTTTATGQVYLYQLVEDLTRELQRSVGTGEKFTLSFDAYSNVGESVALVAQWKNITDTTFSTPYISDSFTLSTSVTRHEITFELPALEAGYNTSDEYALLIEISTVNTAVDATRVFSKFKLERGYKATKFIPDLPSVNKSKCQRFYFISSVHRVSSGYLSASGNEQWYDTFPVTMRSIPTVLYTSFDTQGLNVVAIPASVDANGIRNYVQKTSTAGNYITRYSLTVDAEL